MSRRRTRRNPRSATRSRGGRGRRSQAHDQRLDGALEAHRAGDLGEAKRRYSLILDAQPDNAEALHLLGVVAHQRGKPVEAARYMARAIALNPREPRYHNNLGEVLRRQGSLARAADAYRRAIELDPRYVEAHNNLGIVLRAEDQAAQARRCFERALALAPGMLEATMNLGGMLCDGGDREAAASVFRDLVARTPRALEAQVSLAMVLLSLGRAAEVVERVTALERDGVRHPALELALADALAAEGDTGAAATRYQEILMRDPANVDAHCALATLHSAAGRPEAALEQLQSCVDAGGREAGVYAQLADTWLMCGGAAEARSSIERALALAPQCAMYHDLHAWALRDLGLLDESLSALEAALALEPDSAAALGNLGKTLYARGELEASVDALARARALDAHSADTHTSLGKSLVALGRIEEAIGCYRSALDVQPDFAAAWENLSRARRYRAGDSAEITRLEALAGRARAAPLIEATLHFALGKMLDDCAEYERAFAHVDRANRLKRATLHFDADAHGEWVDRAIATFCPAFFEARRDLGSQSEVPVFIVGMLRSGTTLVEQVLSSHACVHGAGELSTFHNLRLHDTAALGESGDYVARIDALSPANARSLAEAYLQRLRRGAGSAARVTDKMPTNFLHLGLIALLFPGARVIHCRREALDVGLSIYFQNLSAINPYAFDLYEIGRFYRDYERLMAHWKRAAPLRIHEVVYEDLVADLPAVARDLVAFADLAWDGACVEFHRNRRPVQTASDWQVRQPLYRHALARWRHYEGHLGPLRAGLGGEGA